MEEGPGHAMYVHRPPGAVKERRLSLLAQLTHYPADRLQSRLSDSSSALVFRFSRGSRGGRLRPARCRAPRCIGHPLPPPSLALPRAARSRPTHARCTHVAAASSSFLDATAGAPAASGAAPLLPPPRLRPRPDRG